MRRTAPGVAIRTGELLPRLFTLIRQLADGYFLLRYHTLADIFPLGSMALCVVRTFLPGYPGRWNGLLRCKDTKQRESLKILHLEPVFYCAPDDRYPYR